MRGGNHRTRIFDSDICDEIHRFRNEGHIVSFGNRCLLIEHEDLCREDHRIFSCDRRIFFFAPRIFFFAPRIFFFAPRIFFFAPRISFGKRSLFSENRSLFPCGRGLLAADPEPSGDRQRNRGASTHVLARTPGFSMGPAGRERERRRHRAQRLRPQL